MVDSGAHFFIGDAMYYRQIDDITINLCVAHQITDEQWGEYLEGCYVITQKLKRPPNAGVMCCMNAFPNAKQRQMSDDFLKKYYKHRFLRVAIITESAMIRGAMTAMRWVIPTLTMRAFAPAAIRDGMQWVREVTEFDTSLAMNAWSDALTKLSAFPIRDKKLSAFPPHDKKT
jgi:hypothetical protein